MKTCKRCGTEYEPNQKYCSDCKLTAYRERAREYGCWYRKTFRDKTSKMTESEFKQAWQEWMQDFSAGLTVSNL